MAQLSKNLLFAVLLVMHLLTQGAYELRGARLAVSAPAQAAVGERFRVVFTADARPSDFQPPAFTGFRIISGPSQSTSSSTQIINNQVTTSMSVSYTYILEATSEGRFTIGEARVVVDGSTYSSNQHELTISGQAPSSAQSQPSSPQPAQPSLQPPGAQDIFIRTEVSNASPYQSEQVIVTYRLFTRIAVSRYSIDRLPAYQGFWSENLSSTSQPQPTVEIIDGQQYNVVELRRVALFPQRHGELRIEPLEVESLVRMRSQRRSSSIFDDFFGGFQDIPHTIRSNPVVLQVKPLPTQNRPATFKGLVGQYELTATLSPVELQVNDAANLIIHINGTGNLRMAEKPAIQFPPNLEVFDPNVTDQIRNERAGVTGRRVFDYTLIPRSAGEFEIPVINLSYFDPSRGQYVTRQAGPFTMNVTGQPGLSADGSATAYRSDVQSLTTDIRFIMTRAGQLVPAGKLFFRSQGFYLWLILPVTAFLVVIVIGQREIRLRGNKALMRTRKAEKQARKRLKEAARYIAKNDDKAFYDEIFRALWGYLSDKMSIPVSKLNKEEVKKLFANRHIPDKLATQFLHALDTCEYARFAPASEVETNDVIFRQAMDAIVQLEKEFRTKRDRSS